MNGDTVRWIVGVDSRSVHLTTRALALSHAETVECLCGAELRLPPDPPGSIATHRLCDPCFTRWTASDASLGFIRAASEYQPWLLHAVTS